ncbi:MAG: hypothetical protein J5679_00865 [Alphaproteobacteria bacterium]|nr:hypothetical protein [Alphaproteobacteria bacterium]
MTDSVNYDSAINTFLYSAQGVLGEFSSESPKEMSNLADVTLCLKELAKTGNKYTDWTKLGDSLNRLIDAADTRHYGRVGLVVRVVLGNVSAYYKAPENTFKQQRLNNSLKRYWVVATRDPVYKTLFSIMPAQRVIQKNSR